MAIKLNTENTEYITWQFEQLHFGLLGGLKIEGLERMRCNLHDLYTIKRSDIRMSSKTGIYPWPIKGFNNVRELRICKRESILLKSGVADQKL